MGRADRGDEGELMAERIEPPWTPGQVERLNAFQADGRFHPFTCPGERPDCEGRRELVATADGWVCACGEYRQGWAHAFMAEDRR